MISQKVIIVDTNEYNSNGLLENYLKGLHGNDIKIVSKENAKPEDIFRSCLSVTYSVPQTDLDIFPGFITGREKRRLRRTNRKK